MMSYHLPGPCSPTTIPWKRVPEETCPFPFKYHVVLHTAWSLLKTGLCVPQEIPVQHLVSSAIATSSLNVHFPQSGEISRKTWLKNGQSDRWHCYSLIHKRRWPWYGFTCIFRSMCGHWLRCRIHSERVDVAADHIYDEAAFWGKCWRARRLRFIWYAPAFFPFLPQSEWWL